jgi:hypothetical protein
VVATRREQSDGRWSRWQRDGDGGLDDPQSVARSHPLRLAEDREEEIPRARSWSVQRDERVGSAGRVLLSQ